MIDLLIGPAVPVGPPSAALLLSIFSGLRSEDLQFHSRDEAAAGVAFPGRVHRRGSDPRHGTNPYAALGASFWPKGSRTELRSFAKANNVG